MSLPLLIHNENISSYQETGPADQISDTVHCRHLEFGLT